MIWSNLFVTLGWSALGVLIFMILAFGVALKLKRNSVADVAWGLGFIVAATIGMVTNHIYGPRQWLVLSLITIWGLRLAVHIYLRNRGKGEDYRYKELSDKRGSGRWKTFQTVFLSQGLLLLIVGLPVTVVMAAFLQPQLGLLDYIGVVLWIIGFGFEAAGDYQLLQFIRTKSNKGKIMMQGVWRYSRHPNYFGEVTQWWGIGLIALSLTRGYVGLIGPLVISFLIIFVSGVPMLERHYANNKAYQDYARRTSILVPWWPKKV